MAVDHSQTYKKITLRNLLHISRMKSILALMKRECNPAGKRYADVGCSNGYLTAIIHDAFHPEQSTGFDHEPEHIEAARSKYPQLRFEQIELNDENAIQSSEYDVVTCFETLEHTGDLRNAVHNILALSKPNSGRVLISVPIEIGAAGVFKFLLKTLVYRYSLEELSQENGFYWTYLRALLRGERTSRFRGPRKGWSTHFGFDYRDIDDLLRERGVRFRAFNRFMTRFYVIE
jgi:2-polyprenyl-3-methyl-5-hydroxy-6-metoxy-1,4-benzoquinol methylase